VLEWDGLKAAVVLIALAGTAAADATVDPCACSPNKPGFHRASVLTGDWGGIRKHLFDDGMKVTAAYAGEVFVAPALGKDRDRIVNAGLASLAIDFELDKLVDEHLGSIHISGFGIHGKGLELMDIYGVSNNVANDDVRLFEAYIDQPIGPAGVRAGLLSADQEYIIAAHATVLINATFGIVAILPYDVGGPVYPQATPGVSARVETDAVTVRGALYDGDRIDEHGIPTALGDSAFLIGEVELASTLKLGAWHHTTLGTGYYSVLDHQVAKRLGAFTRMAISPGRPIPFYIDAGVRVGPGPLRKKDFFSIGLAFANSNLGVQTAVEMTYQIFVNGWLTVQPDVQLELKRDGNAGVIATRAVVSL
jgi:carbohydrate-selective porin OprB